MKIGRYTLLYIFLFALSPLGGWYPHVLLYAQQHSNKQEWASLAEFTAGATQAIAAFGYSIERANRSIFKATSVQQIKSELENLLNTVPVAKVATYPVCIERLTSEEVHTFKNRFASLFSQLITLIVTIRAKDMLTHKAYTPLYQMHSYGIDDKLHALGEWLQHEYRAIFAVDPTWFYDQALGYERVLNELAHLKADIEVAAGDNLAIATRKQQEEKRIRILVERNKKRRKEQERQLQLLAKQEKIRNERALQMKKLQVEYERKCAERLAARRHEQKEKQSMYDHLEALKEKVALLEKSVNDCHIAYIKRNNETAQQLKSLKAAFQLENGFFGNQLSFGYLCKAALVDAEAVKKFRLASQVAISGSASQVLKDALSLNKAK